MNDLRFDVWEQQGRGRETTGWSNVLRNVSFDEAEQYELAAENRVHVEIHVPPHLRLTSSTG
jgi:hypothetical protein